MKTCARKGCIELAFPGGYFDGLCGRECQNMVEEYQRGRCVERAAVVTWLLGTFPYCGLAYSYAKGIENGEHEVKR